MTSPIRCIFVTFLLLFATTTLAQTAQRAPVEQYPKKPVRIIIPFTAGGGNDSVARILAQTLAERWRQQVVGDNRVGANGIIGANLAAKATADGYTLVLISTSFTINPAMQKLPFDPVKDFAPTALIASSPIILASSPDFAARTIKELIALAKSKPGITYASTGVGGGNHLAGELFQKMTGISMLHVPYKGGSEAAIDVIGGRVSLTFSSVPALLSHIKSGRLRALGIGDLKRSKLLPDIPTIAEEGVTGYESGFWFGIVAPGQTTKSIVQKINRDINYSLETQDVIQRYSALGMEIMRSSPEEFKELIASDMAKWGKIIMEIGLGKK